jgi:tRNA (guanine37-N1)-methyltransferase
MIEQAVAAGIVGRAIERERIAVRVHDLRAFTTDRHRVVDDAPYGGGPGMLLKPEPLFRALDALEREAADAPHVVLTSPQGERFSHATAQRLSEVRRLVLLCGRYEGVDERVKARVHEEISIGDYVLSGGELAALVIVDAVARLVPGVVGDQQSVVEESFTRGLLDFPQYTRPAELKVATGESPAPNPGEGDVGPLRVPDVLLSGNHAEIRRWRKREALARTLARRPDLLISAELDDEERELLDELMTGKQQR